MKIAFTGGSGASGRIIIRVLVAQGHEILNIDRVPAPGLDVPFRQISLTDYGQVLGALMGCDTVIHFGSHPEPDFDHQTAADRFENNTMATFNIFNAATALGINRIIWASSETVMGFPFSEYSPPLLPVTENMTAPQNAYAMSKLLCEQLAEMQCKIHSDLTIIGLRLSNILYAADLPSENGSAPTNRTRDTYVRLPDYWDDVNARDFNLWSYVDVRDVVQAVDKALSAPLTGAFAFNIHAADTLMNRSTKAIFAERFPETNIPDDFGEFACPFSNQHARDVLGYVPEWSWRNVTEVNSHMKVA